MLKKLALVGAMALAVSLAALAANAPTYKDPAGTNRDAQGVVLIDTSGAPYNAASTSAGTITSPVGAGTSAAAVRTTQASDSPLVTQTGAVTETAPATDTASSGLNGRLQRIAQRLSTMIAAHPTALGGTTAANSFPVVLSSDGPFATQTGSVTETAPATDTASSGLNGRLQRIAQRVTSLIALLPSSLGAKTTANSLSVAPASDLAFGSAVTLTRPATTPGYSANDVVKDTGGAALSFTLGAGAGQYMITSASLEIDAAAIISGETSYILYLYNVTPPSALADDAAWDLPSGDRASFLGAIQLGAPADLGSTLFVETNGINKQITTASASVFGYLVTVGAHTSTASRVYVVTLHTALVH